MKIDGKPGWANLDHATWRIWGTPGASKVGVYWDIEIRVTDGRDTTTLDPFSIAVDQFGFGSATLSWNPPTENSNGSMLIDLAGYRIYYGRSPARLTEQIMVDNPGLTRYVIENLSPGNWLFALTAVNSHGVESRRSKIVKKRIG